MGAEPFLNQPGQLLVLNLLGIPEHLPVKIDITIHSDPFLALLYGLTASSTLFVVNKAAIFSEM